MSAFVVSNRTIDRAVFLMTEPGESLERCQQFGNELFALNCKAVNQRYPNHEPEQPPEYDPLCQQYSQIDALVGLQCLIYQCTEGDVPKTELYRKLRETELRTLQAIVAELPEYDTAAWD